MKIKKTQFDHYSYAACLSSINTYIIEEFSYYPFGMKHNRSNNVVHAIGGVLGQKYKKYRYNGKELQDELGLNLYDYGARNYDPAIGRWMNMDPLAEKSRRWSPYSYCYNNPLRFIDPDGMEVDDIYKLDKAGNITFVQATDDGHDTLYAVNNTEPYSTNDSGNIDYSKSIDVEKGVLNNIEHATGFYSKEDYDFMKVDGNESATNLFEFVSENSNVEWSQVQVGENSNYITTSHDSFSESGGTELIMKGVEDGTFTNIKQQTHSHPDFPITGAGSSPPDRASAKAIEHYNEKYNNQVKTRVYDASRKVYTTYNSQGNVKE